MKGFEKMKKVLAVLLAATMLFGMASCSSGNGNSSEAGSSAGSSAESGESIPESSSGDVKIKVTTSANSGRPGLEAQRVIHAAIASLKSNKPVRVADTVE